MPRLTLVGFRGTGKTTVAASLAERLGCGWLDADDAFERRNGGTVADFFAAHGEVAFRDRETDVLEDLLRECRGVLATGGGVVTREENRRLLRAYGRPVVWLDATAEAVRGRLAADASTASRRPSLTGADPFVEIERLLEERGPLYAEVADLRIDTSQSPPDELVGRIVQWLESRAAADVTDGGA